MNTVHILRENPNVIAVTYNSENQSDYLSLLDFFTIRIPKYPSFVFTFGGDDYNTSYIRVSGLNENKLEGIYNDLLEFIEDNNQDYERS